MKVFIRKLLPALLLLISQLTSYSQQTNTFDSKADLRFLDSLPDIENYQIVDLAGYNVKDLGSLLLAEQYAKKSLYSHNKVYFDWKEMENYLNVLLQRIAPDSIRELKHIHVFPARIPYANAFVYGSGSMYFNVGLFGSMNSEASVAIVLAHELAHYILGHHHLRSVREQLLKKKLRKPLSKWNKMQHVFSHAKYSREQELEADSLGFILAARAGYDLKYGIDNFRRFQDAEELAEQRKAVNRVKTRESLFKGLRKEEVRKLLEEYPDMEFRLEQLVRMMQQIEDGNRHAFIEDSAVFAGLRKKAWLEKLKLLLEEDVRECTRSAFLYYLSDPADGDYLYYLLESLRQRILIFQGESDQPFLTDDFLNHRFGRGEGILHDLSALIADSMLMQYLPPNELTDPQRIEFETYGEAWRYFSRLALERRIPESYLTLAIAETSPVLRDSLLNIYLGYENCRHRDYALALREDKLYSSLSDNTRDVFLFDFPEYYYYSIRDFNARPNSHESFVRQLTSITKKIKGKPEIFFSYDLLQNNAGMLYGLMRIQYLMQYLRMPDTISTFDPLLMVQKTTLTVRVDPLS
jgi:Zn-dependent protease with chaperone function